MSTGNMFLDAADKRTAEFTNLTSAQKKLVKKLHEDIKSARTSENLAYEKLAAFSRAGRAIPEIKLLDDSVSNDPTVIRADIKNRTSMRVAKLTAEIKALMPSWTEDWSEKAAQVQVSGLKKLGRLAGKCLHPIVDGGRKGIAEFKTATKEGIDTAEDHALGI